MKASEPKAGDQTLKDEDFEKKIDTLLLPSETPRRKRADLSEQTASAFAALFRCSRKPGAARTEAFAASLADIEKPLRVKQRSHPREKLPSRYHRLWDAFDQMKADQPIIPHRKGTDHNIRLEKDA